MTPQREQLKEPGIRKVENEEEEKWESGDGGEGRKNYP